MKRQLLEMIQHDRIDEIDDGKIGVIIVMLTDETTLDIYVGLKDLTF